MKRLYHIHDEAAQKMVDRVVAVLMLLQHPHIVQYFGLMMEGGKRPCIVLELMHGGNLADAGSSLSVPAKMCLMRQVSLALSSIHSRSPVIVHKDVPCGHICVCQGCSARLEECPLAEEKSIPATRYSIRQREKEEINSKRCSFILDE